MGEPTPKETTKQQPTSHLTATAPPQRNPLPKPEPQPNKRKLSHHADLHNSAYFKIRALAAQLRPHFIQVLQTPDFRNCKAAHEIHLQMKLMVDLYEQMIAEEDQVETFMSEHKPLAGDNLLGKPFSGGLKEEEKPYTPEPKPTRQESLEEKPHTLHFSLDKKPDIINQHRQSYIVGGSVFGWNFITFLGSTPVYYGVTKELFRSSHKKPFAQTK